MSFLVLFARAFTIFSFHCHFWFYSQDILHYAFILCIHTMPTQNASSVYLAMEISLVYFPLEISFFFSNRTGLQSDLAAVYHPTHLIPFRLYPTLIYVPTPNSIDYCFIDMPSLKLVEIKWYEEFYFYETLTPFQTYSKPFHCK